MRLFLTYDSYFYLFSEGIVVWKNDDIVLLRFVTLSLSIFFVPLVLTVSLVYILVQVL